MNDKACHTWFCAKHTYATYFYIQNMHTNISMITAWHISYMPLVLHLLEFEGYVYLLHWQGWRWCWRRWLVLYNPVLNHCNSPRLLWPAHCSSFKSVSPSISSRYWYEFKPRSMALDQFRPWYTGVRGSRGSSESTERSSQNTHSNVPQCSVIGALIKQPESQSTVFFPSGLSGLILFLLRELLLNELFI